MKKNVPNEPTHADKISSLSAESADWLLLTAYGKIQDVEDEPQRELVSASSTSNPDSLA